MTRSCALAAVGRPELRRVLHPQVVADVVGLGGAVEHDEEDWLLPERLELVAVLPPALDASREVALVLDARDVGPGLVEPGGDALHRALDDAVDDRLLQRVVEDGPGEEPALLVARRRREVELPGEPAGLSSWRRRMTLLHSLSSSWTWWPSSLMTRARRAASRDALVEVLDAARRGRRDRSEDIGHDLRLVGLGDARPFVELLDVRQVERTLRAGPLRVAAHVEVHLPEDAQLRRDDRVGAEDPPAAEVGAQPLEDDDVRSDDEEGLGVVVAPLGHGVEVLPGDGERHDLRLAAAGRHLDGIPGEVVVLEDVDARHLGEPLDEVTVPTDPLDLVEPDERLHRLALGVVVLEGSPVGRAGGRYRTSS